LSRGRLCSLYPILRRHRVRALVVEDDAQVGEILSVALGDDYDVICVAQPDEALATLIFGDCVDVLLDYFLAGGNGDGIAKHADQIGVPLVLMTGSSDAIKVNYTHTILPKPFGVQAALRRTGLSS
jgi:DNA-binding NtrC family response regulator